MANETVLIVDDEVDVLDLCKRILQTQGYTVKHAQNGYEAIEIARAERFDLLLTDIKMPGMNGLEIAQVLKESDPGMICVTMTGFSTMDMAIDALKLGIDEFILKPFTPKELSAAIAKALEKERLRKENFRLRSLIPLFELNRTLLGTVEEENVLNSLLEIAHQETNAYFAKLYLLKGNTFIDPICSKKDGICTEAQKEASYKLAQVAVENNESMTLTIHTIDPNHQALIQQLEVTSVVTSPLKSKTTNLGVLLLAHKNSYFAPSDSEFLSVLCGQASIALENARLFTEIQDAYEQLKLLDHMKSEFINIAAHELRTPLAILMGYAAVLEEESPELQQIYAANITRNAMRLRALIDDMLNLSNLETGITSLAHDEVNLEEVIDRIIQDLSLIADQKQLEVKFNIPANFPIMIIDRQKLDLILVNLSHNAFKFTPLQGVITFTAHTDVDRAIVAVHNTGSVIPANKLQKVFGRFFQVESSLIREHGGAGLGLSIAKGMTGVCGGEISVQSSEPDGTTFTVVLPLDNSNLTAQKLNL